MDRYVVTEELLAAGAPVAAHWVADRPIGPSLLRHGGEVQRQRFLPGIVRGEMYSDLASVRTRAERVDGDGCSTAPRSGPAAPITRTRSSCLRAARRSRVTAGPA